MEKPLAVGEFLSRALLPRLEGHIDTDEITDVNLHFVPHSQRLVVGKYVPDEVPTTVGDAASSSENDAAEASPSLSTPEAVDSLSTTAVHFVVPSIEGSSAPLYFPIHYPATTHKDKADARGLPLVINKKFHGHPDRSAITTVTAAVKTHNRNKIPLYKVGPGAVAFRVVLNAMEAAGMQYTTENSLSNLLWAKRGTPQIFGSLTPYQKINHFPGTWGIGRKDSLHKNVSKMRRQFGEEAFDIVPKTFLIPSDLELVRRDCAAALATSGAVPTYIVKPSASSCGKGIFLSQGVPTLPAGSKQMICQRYISNPMIVHGRKFDLRMYCVVTGFDPLRIYLFDQGLVRFAAEKYPGADQLLENANAHLTNYSINKVSALAKQSKGKEVDSDDAIDIKWAISDLKEWLRGQHGNAKGDELWLTIYNKSRDVVIKTFLSIENEVVSKIRSDCASDPTGSRCFELYGLDLMVDDTLNVTLIEANIMPSLATGSTLDKAVKARMLAHMLTLAGVHAEARDVGGEEENGEEEEEEVPLWFSNKRYFVTTSEKHGASSDCTFLNVECLTRFNDASNPHSLLSNAERRMLGVAQEELARAGGFDRIFPQSDSFERYAHLFSNGMLRSNFLLMSHAAMMRKHQCADNDNAQ